MFKGLLAFVAALAVAGCAEGYYGPYGGGGLAYYDDYYGPFDDGYWGPDGFFYFRGRDHRFFRDGEHHFRRGPAAGFHGVHGHAGFHGFTHGGFHGGGFHGGGHR
jgi:hypothetical protein